MGGFAANQDIDLAQRSRALVTYRVPADRFDDALDALAGVGELRNQQVDGQDVTAQYADLEGRVATVLLVALVGVGSDGAPPSRQPRSRWDETTPRDSPTPVGESRSSRSSLSTSRPPPRNLDPDAVITASPITANPCLGQGENRPDDR
ncbi:MAG: DUF4349 domain-containing protein [Microthrixaceae bacterium]